MTVEQNKVVVDRFFTAVNERDFSVLDEVLTDDFSTPLDAPGLSRDALKSVLAYYVAAFPDLTYDIVAMIGEDDALAVHLNMHGTHKGDYQGNAGTGKTFSVDEVEMMRFRDGKIAGFKIIWDEAEFRRQLGFG
jgi:steroid delta-isomerase-like uncharacterized protein